MPLRAISGKMYPYSLNRRVSSHPKLAESSLLQCFEEACSLISEKFVRSPEVGGYCRLIFEQRLQGTAQRSIIADRAVTTHASDRRTNFITALIVSIPCPTSRPEPRSGGRGPTPIGKLGLYHSLGFRYLFTFRNPFYLMLKI